MTAYGDRAYRAARAALEASTTPPACWRRCGREASTIDHVPALAQHDHVAGTNCCLLLPCCAACNYRAGARLANRVHTDRRPGTTSRRW